MIPPALQGRSMRFRRRILKIRQRRGGGSGKSAGAAHSRDGLRLGRLGFRGNFAGTRRVEPIGISVSMSTKRRVFARQPLASLSLPKPPIRQRFAGWRRATILKSRVGAAAFWAFLLGFLVSMVHRHVASVTFRSCCRHRSQTF